MMSDLRNLLDEPRVFLRVYLLPSKLTDGYCFGGGVPITMLNVDWFEAPVSYGRANVERFIKGKRYYRPDQRYLVLGDLPEFVFTINANGQDNRVVR